MFFSSKWKLTSRSLSLSLLWSSSIARLVSFSSACAFSYSLVASSCTPILILMIEIQNHTLTKGLPHFIDETHCSVSMLIVLLDGGLIVGKKLKSIDKNYVLECLEFSESAIFFHV